MTEPTEVEYSEMPVRIARDGIYIGGRKIPGCIEAGSVTVHVGEDCNHLDVRFIVGKVRIDDDMWGPR